MYWVDATGTVGPGQINRIQSANLDGSDVETLISGVGSPWGIAVGQEVVPEPSSLIVWSLIGLSFAGIGWRRRRKHQEHIQ